MKIFKIKMEDKAAFINHLNKLEVSVDTYEIVDDKLHGLFEFSTDEPHVIEIVKTILKQSPKINIMHERQLIKKLVKEEIQRILSSK
jgi:hypothetical protein